MAGEAGIERRRLQLFTRLQAVAEIEGIESTGYPHLLHGGLLDRDAPAAAPAQRAKPHRAALLCCLPRPVDGKPRIRLVRCAAAAALDDVRSGLQRLGVKLPLRSPVAGEIVPAVALPVRQAPGGRLRALQGDGLIGSIFNARPPLEDAQILKDAVVEVNLEG